MVRSYPIEISIQILSSKAVQPCHGSSSSSEWDTRKATNDVVPLTVLDELYDDEYMSSIHAFRPPAPSNAVLEAGLARALAVYRKWAGRLVVVDNSTGRRRRRAILLNDAGARFVEATADVALETIMPALLPTAPVVRRLHPSPSCDDDDDDGPAADQELMLVQVTRFACCSLVVGHTMHHAVGDGFAMAHCLLAWGQATRNVAIDPVPVHERESLFVPTHGEHDPPQVLFEHRGTDFVRARGNHQSSNDHDEVVTHVVRFSREVLTDLKSRAHGCSTVECLVAHLWRCMTRARGLDVDGGHETTTTLHVAVNGRRARMMSCRPLVPTGYTGNAVLWAHPTTTVGELLARPLGQASDLIRREVARVDDAYFRSFVSFVESVDVKEEGLVSMADAAECLDDGEVYCLRGIPFYDLDFGGGQQFLFMPSYRPVDGLIYILPSAPFGDGSVEAQVSLFSRVMDAFKHYCCSLF